MKTTQTFDLFCTSLVGLQLRHIWRGYGSAIFLEIGDLTYSLRKDGTQSNPKGEIALEAECGWRIEDDRSIICGSWSDDRCQEHACDRLRGCSIKKCELFGILPEVIITTHNRIRFITFSTTEGQPQWGLVDRRCHLDHWFTVRNGRLHLGDGKGDLNSSNEGEWLHR